MLQLLSPLALIALAALAIPAVLHLWRPPPRTVRLGTLRFFTGPAVRRLTKLRWRERLLLVVRLLLLATLALLLAQPIWRKPALTEPQRWAVVESGVVLEGQALKRLDELIDRGFQRRELAPGFPGVSGRARAQRPADEPDVWSMLRELDAFLPAGSSVTVFASDRFMSLRGERPLMQHCEVEWISVPAANSAAATWIRAAEMIEDGKVRVAIRRSHPEAAEEIAAFVPAAPGRTALDRPLDGWFVELANAAGDKLSARLLREGTDAAVLPWVPVAPQRSLEIAIVHAADRGEDARYVRAALNAISEVSGCALTTPADARRADWIFWLDDEQPAAEIVEQVRSRGGTLFSDAENSRDRSLAVRASFLAEPLIEPVGLFRRVPTSAAAVGLWNDSYGAPLLSLTREGNGRHLRFFSRFHPEWNELPQSSALASALRALLLHSTDDASRDRQHDTRRVDAGQARPAEKIDAAVGRDVRLAAPAELIDLHTTVWLLCAALFAVERALSHYNRASARPEPVRTSRRAEPALAKQT